MREQKVWKGPTCHQCRGVGLYTVKQVVAMTGLTASRLRAWERRYGVVQPRRTDAQYRMFSEEDVQRLRTMAHLVEAGVSASTAAAIVLSEPALTDAPGGPTVPIEDFVEAAADLDVLRLATILSEVLVLDGFEAICDGWLMAAIVELDRRRKAGSLLDVHVRTAEQAIVLRLGAMVDPAMSSPPRWQSLNPSRARPMVLIGQQEPSGRDLVPMLFTVALRRHGVDSRYLGRGISTDGWQRALQQLRPRAVAISTSSARGRLQARELSAAVAATALPVQVWLGGPGHDPTEPWVLPMHMLDATHAMLGQLWSGALPGSSAPSAQTSANDH